MLTFYKGTKEFRALINYQDIEFWFLKDSCGCLPIYADFSFEGDHINIDKDVYGNLKNHFVFNLLMEYV